MNKRNCIYIAKNDIKCKPKYCSQMIKGIFFIMLILMISTLIVQAVNSYYDSVIYGDSASNDIISYGFMLDENNKITKESYNLLNTVSDMEEISTVSVFFELLLPNKDGDCSVSGEYLENVVININGKGYTGNKSLPENKLSVQLCMEGTDFIEASDEKYFNYRYPKENLIIAGSQPVAEKEIVISEYLLTELGIIDYEQLIGKSISVDVNGYNLFSDYKLVGVINSLSHSVYDPQIYIVENKENFNNYTLNSYGTFIACVDNPNSSVDIYEKLKNKEFLDSVFYDEGNAKIFTYAGKIRTAVKNIMICVATFILIGMVMSLYSVVSSSISDSRSYYGILQAMGMPKRTMTYVFILEQLFFIIVSLVISIIVSGVVLIVMNAGLNFVIADELEISFFDFISSSLVVAGISGALILFMTTVIFLIYQRKEITENLKTSKIY